MTMIDIGKFKQFLCGILLLLVMSNCEKNDELVLTQLCKVESIDTGTSWAEIKILFNDELVLNNDSIAKMRFLYGEIDNPDEMSSTGKYTVTSVGDEKDNIYLVRIDNLKPGVHYYFRICPGWIDYRDNPVLSLKNYKYNNDHARPLYYGETLQFNPIEGGFETRQDFGVDLGLSVRWASFDLGASNDTEQGSLVNWSVNYNPDNIPEKLNISGTDEDQATKMLGNGWRTPTKEEFEELIAKCNWDQMYYKNTLRAFYEITGPNGNSIKICANGVTNNFNYFTANAEKFDDTYSVWKLNYDVIYYYYTAPNLSLHSLNSTETGYIRPVHD